MTKKQLLALLEDEAKAYRNDALDSIARNRRMNDLTKRDIVGLRKNFKLFERLRDALLVDFINFIGTEQGLDQGLRTEHLQEK